MSEINIALRPVSMSDAATLLAWRNDPSTRNNSRGREPIPLEQHLAWLSRVLASTDHVMRMVDSGGHPVGVVRADRTADGWELSWTVASQARGQGIGRKMLRTFVAQFEGHLTAYIRKDNVEFGEDCRWSRSEATR